jgi:hypothetical protein
MEVRGKKGRGRPKKRWKDCVKQDLSEKNSTGYGVHNRAAWKGLARKRLGRRINLIYFPQEVFYF